METLVIIVCFLFTVYSYFAVSENIFSFILKQLSGANVLHVACGMTVMVQKSKYLINQIIIIYFFASGPQVTKTLYLLDIFYRFKTLTGQVNYLPWGLMFSDITDKPQKENVNKLLSDIRGITGGKSDLELRMNRE